MYRQTIVLRTVLWIGRWLSLTMRNRIRGRRLPMIDRQAHRQTIVLRTDLWIGR